MYLDNYIRLVSELRSLDYACIKLVMAKSGSYRIPTTAALVAFECAARTGSFAGAAKELGTSQPAVSRHIASLEKQHGTKFFERSRTGVRLTEAGRQFHTRVAPALDMINTAVSETAEASEGKRVAIACSYPTSHYLLRPRHDALREALGEHTQIQLVIFNRYSQNLPVHPVPDVVLDWEATIRAEDRTALFREAVRPVCSAEYLATHADTLNGPVSGWSGLTFLEPGSADGSCASWEDWFRAAGRPRSAPRFIGFDNYVYSLEAAVEGQGIALGWKNFADRNLESGALVALGDGYVERDNHFCAALTEQGRIRPIARQCLSFLEQSASSQENE